MHSKGALAGYHSVTAGKPYDPDPLLTEEQMDKQGDLWINVLQAELAHRALEDTIHILVTSQEASSEFTFFNLQPLQLKIETERRQLHAGHSSSMQSFTSLNTFFPEARLERTMAAPQSGLSQVTRGSSSTWLLMATLTVRALPQRQSIEQMCTSNNGYSADCKSGTAKQFFADPPNHQLQSRL
jgi:hypothetical protein